MLTDSACRLVISEAKHINQVASGTATAIVDIRRIAGGNPKNPPTVTRPNHLAYVIYTSGSTGMPKGCQIELGNLIHYLSWADRFYFPDEQGGCFGLYSPVSFDLTVTSLFLPLLRGKTLHVFPAEAELLDIFDCTFREDSPIDSIKLTPSHISLLRHLRISRSNIRLAIVGGEALSLEQVRILRGLNPQMEIYNEYGPTETTVGCVVKRMEVSDEQVLIGKPIANTCIYVMREGNLMPIGMAGEILISGAGVGRGYLNRDDLNRRAFAADVNLAGQRLYRTGDLGRWLPDGNLEFLGRADYQMKIRGYRIEPGEIENRLLELSTVRRAVVDTRCITGDGSDLVAYVVAENGWTAAGAREFLAESLPDYMVPAFFVNLETFPLTPNGKVDRAALPHPTRAQPERTTPYAGPRDEVEQTLAEIWRKVLALEKVSVHDRFLDLGGHSLKAMQIVSQIHKRLGTKVPLRTVFEKPTIAELATELQSSEKNDYDPIKPASLRDYYDLSHAQQRLWLLQHLQGATAYNMPAAFVINEAPDMVALNRAFGTLIERHEALRTAFILVKGEPQQQILPPPEFRVDEIDFRKSEQPAQDARTYVEQLASTPFDLVRPPLLRAAVIQLSERRFCFALTMHHIVGDGWSERILYREVLALYEAYRNGRPNPLRPLRIQYKDFAVWQNARGFQREEEYWLKKLAGATHSLSLKCDFPRPQERDFRGAHEHFGLENEIARPLRGLARRTNTTVANLLLAIFKLFLFRLTGQEDICVGMGSANRNHPDVEHLIGFFVNALPIRTRLHRSMEFEELLGQIIDNTSEALEYGDYPFDLLVRRLNPARTTNRQPLFNVAYVFQNLDDLTIDIAGERPRHPELADDPDPAQADAFSFSLDISKFDLTLVAANGPRDSIELLMEYDTNLFRRETIQHYLSVFRRFAETVARSAEADQGADKTEPSEVH
jgi:amino acid adenylation domain-containing protein